MVRSKIFGLFILPILLLSSCNRPKALRSDIAEFITSFSLQESMNTYREAGYESVKTSTIDGDYVKEVDKVDFNIKDESNISYLHVLTKYDRDNNITFTKTEKIEKSGDDYIHTLDGQSETYTVQQCADLVKTFFYVGEPMEGYHDYSIYYGDYVQSSAAYAQDSVTIDQDNKLYVFESDVRNDSQGQHLYQKYTVNQLGMLMYNHLDFTNQSNNIVQTITVYNRA